MLNRIRYWIIRLLADGDLLILNAEFLSNGCIRRRAGGGIKIVDCLFSFRRPNKGIGFGRGIRSGDGFSLAITEEKNLTVNGCSVEVHDLPDDMFEVSGPELWLDE